MLSSVDAPAIRYMSQTSRELGNFGLGTVFSTLDFSSLTELLLNKNSLCRTVLRPSNELENTGFRINA